MKLIRIQHLIGITVYFGCVFPEIALAQVQPAPVKVPLSGCASCLPTDVDACCVSFSFSCIRQDTGPIVVNPGTPSTMTSAAIDCDNCFSDCPCCPVLQVGSDDCAECWNLPVKTCLENITISWSYGKSFGISSTIGATLGAEGIASIKSQLTASMGVTQEATFEFSTTCGWNAMPPCQHMSTTPFVDGIVGKKSR